MPTLRELLEQDWEQGRERGILPPQLDLVTADEQQAERQEEEDAKRLYR